MSGPMLSLSLHRNNSPRPLNRESEWVLHTDPSNTRFYKAGEWEFYKTPDGWVYAINESDLYQIPQSTRHWVEKVYETEDGTWTEYWYTDRDGLLEDLDVLLEDPDQPMESRSHLVVKVLRADEDIELIQYYNKEKLVADSNRDGSMQIFYGSDGKVTGSRSGVPQEYKEHDNFRGLWLPTRFYQSGVNPLKRGSALQQQQEQELKKRAPTLWKKWEEHAS